MVFIFFFFFSSRRRHTRCALVTGVQTCALPISPVADLVKAVDIPYQQFTLPNGLRVIVSTDRKAPVVAVSVWYHVGSKNEPKSKTGFAHLFEHLMFNGSENADGEFFWPIANVGATDFKIGRAPCRERVGQFV